MKEKKKINEVSSIVNAFLSRSNISYEIHCELTASIAAL